MPIHALPILVASVLQFIFGAIWYTPIFGKAWGKIHGFDAYSKEEQAKMMRDMWRPLLAQFLVTVLTTYVLALFLSLFRTQFPDTWHAFGIAGFAWLGFVLPTQISAVLFGGTKPGMVLKKIAIMAGASLGCLMIAAAVLELM